MQEEHPVSMTVVVFTAIDVVMKYLPHFPDIRSPYVNRTPEVLGCIDDSLKGIFVTFTVKTASKKKVVFSSIPDFKMSTHAIFIVVPMSEGTIEPYFKESVSRPIGWSYYVSLAIARSGIARTGAVYIYILAL